MTVSPPPPSHIPPSGPPPPGPYGYGATPPPGVPWQPVVHPPLSGMAVASLVLSLPVCLAPVGLVLGIVALVRIPRNGKRGKGLAVAGTAVGASVVALSVLLDHPDATGWTLGNRTVLCWVGPPAGLLEKSLRQDVGDWDEGQLAYLTALRPASEARASRPGDGAGEEGRMRAAVGLALPGGGDMAG